MPGILKIPVISPLYYISPVPRTNWVRTLATTNTTTVSSAVPGRLIYSTSTAKGWWWSRKTASAPPVHFPIPNSYQNFKLVGFGGWRSFSSSSPPSSVASGGTSQGLNSGAMGATFTSDDDNKDKHGQDSKKPPPSNSEKLLTLPTILTIGRVAAVPLLVSTFYANSWWGPNATTGIFILAAITDWLDGYLARKMKLGTAFGAFLDPVADKLMVATALVLLCTRPLEVGLLGQVPWLLTVPAIAIIGREITMSAVREWAASQDGKLSEAVAVNNLGKWKTATQMTALTILLAARDSSLIGSGTLVASGVLLLYISAWLSVWSLIVYMRKIWKFLV